MPSKTTRYSLRILLPIIICLCSFPSFAQTDTTLWDADNQINTLSSDGDRVYAGGDFTYFGPATGKGVSINKHTGLVPESFPKITGRIADSVKCAIADNAGGWYIAGTFTKIGNTPVSGLVHLNPDLSLDAAFNCTSILPQSINCLALAGRTLYAGMKTGSPGTIQGVDAETGRVPAWALAVEGPVYQLAVNNNLLYVAGAITKVRDSLCAGLAVIDLITGFPLETFPKGLLNTGAVVTAVAITHDTLFIAGTFSTVNGMAQTNFAAVNAVTGSTIPFTTEPVTGTVYGMTVQAGNLYVAGRFSSVGANDRENLAAFSLATGATGTWVPQDFFQDAGYKPVITNIMSDDKHVYVSGRFRTIARKQVHNFAALDLVTGLPADSLSVCMGAQKIYAMAMQGNSIYLGGNFKSIGGKMRYGLASFYAANGQITDWCPIKDYYFMAHVSGSCLYNNSLFVCGPFGSLAGADRKSIGGIDKITGEITTWLPYHVDNSVRYIAGYGNLLYMGGDFLALNTTPRRYAMCLSAVTSNSNSWNPAPDVSNSITSIAGTPGGNIFVAGTFSNFGGQNRAGLALTSLSLGLAKPWNPNPNGAVNTLLSVGSRLYAGGNYTTIDSVNINRLCVFDAQQNLTPSFNPNPNGAVTGLSYKDSLLFVSGKFTRIAGQDLNGFAALHARTGEPVSIENHYLNIAQTMPASDRVYVRGTNITGPNYESFFGCIKAPGVLTGSSEILSPERRLLHAWPNPANSLLNISLIPGAGQNRPELYDITGRPVKPDMQNTGNTWQANIADFAPGVYILQYAGRSGRVVKQ
ncbi:MAG: T9SS type A sorting domain-containing protein [Bacteroidota bacterium]